MPCATISYSDLPGGAGCSWWEAEKLLALRNMEVSKGEWKLPQRETSLASRSGSRGQMRPLRLFLADLAYLPTKSATTRIEFTHIERLRQVSLIAGDEGALFPPLRAQTQSEYAESARFWTLRLAICGLADTHPSLACQYRGRDRRLDSLYRGQCVLRRRETCHF